MRERQKARTPMTGVQFFNLGVREKAFERRLVVVVDIPIKKSKRRGYES
jgi:hypothetical protein